MIQFSFLNFLKDILHHLIVPSAGRILVMGIPVSFKKDGYLLDIRPF